MLATSVCDNSFLSLNIFSLSPYFIKYNSLILFVFYNYIIFELSALDISSYFDYNVISPYVDYRRIKLIERKNGGINLWLVTLGLLIMTKISILVLHGLLRKE